MNTLTALDDDTTVGLRMRLLELARRQDDLAAEEAAATPYWQPQPATVHGHRSAADALRAEADRQLSGCAS
jgi:hypothetical protein